MYPRLRPWFLASAVSGALLFAACQKNAPVADAPRPKAAAPEVGLVKESERSKHFTAVNKQLELGGPLYAYVDIDGDMQKLVGNLQRFMVEISKSEPRPLPFLQKDFVALATTLGLTDIKAIGASSVPDGNGYFRNRTFFYTGGERHGLMAGLGGKPGPFTHLNLAPADTAVYLEAEIDVPAVYTAIKNVIERIDGQGKGDQMEDILKKGGEQITLSVLDLIHGLKGHSSLVLRVDGEHPVRLPGPQPVMVPGIAGLISIDGVGPVIEPSLIKAGLKGSDVSGFRVYEFPQPLPVNGTKPVLIVDGNTLHLATSLAFFRECREQRTGLAENAEFKSALAAIGPEGNGLMYVSPRLFAEVAKLLAANPDLPPQSKSLLSLFLGGGSGNMGPLISVRSNLPDGILVRSRWNRSLKPELALASANPVTIGLLAAMAIPAFQKVRSSSQEKAVLNNLRQLAAAADQYYIENGVRTATYDQLVGPTRYVKAMNAVVGENYRTLRFAQGQPFRLPLPDGRVITYPPGTVQPARPPAPVAPKGR